MHGSTPGVGWGAEERAGPGACGTGWRARGAAGIARKGVCAPGFACFWWSFAAAEDAGCHGNPLQAAQAEAALPDCLHEAPG